MRTRRSRNVTTRRLLTTIRRSQAQRLRRAIRLDGLGHEWAFEVYRDDDEAFIRELCLLLLVALWHEVERELIRLAARVTPGGGPLNGEDYRQRVRVEREAYRRRNGRRQLLAKLRVQTLPFRIETLRLLANCYKHDPWVRPDPDLLSHLKLPSVPEKRPLRVDYARLPDSRIFQDKLAETLGLAKEANFCDIAARFLADADSFLDDIEHMPLVGRVEWGPVRLDRFEG